MLDRLSEAAEVMAKKVIEKLGRTAPAVTQPPKEDPRVVVDAPKVEASGSARSRCSPRRQGCNQRRRR
jgi:hypothetical protein